MAAPTPRAVCGRGHRCGLWPDISRRSDPRKSTDLFTWPRHVLHSYHCPWWHARIGLSLPPTLFTESSTALPPQAHRSCGPDTWNFRYVFKINVCLWIIVIYRDLDNVHFDLYYCLRLSVLSFQVVLESLIQMNFTYSELIKATQPFGYNRMEAELLMLSRMVFKIILW